MTHYLSKLDRRLALAVLALVASATLLVTGLFSIFAAMGDSVDLPNEGSLQEILNDRGGSGNPADAGPSGPPPPTPIRLTIPRLYIDAPVVAMGLGADRYPEVPDAPEKVAWYTFTSAPGQSGNAVFSGHVDWITRSGDPIPGVFYRLRELEIGDDIGVTLKDGATLQYRVTGNVAIPYDDPNVVKVMQGTTRDVLTLITCGGTWVKDSRTPLGGNYSHRIIVRADRVVGLAEGGASAGG